MDAKLYAIAEALDIAVREDQNSRGMPFQRPAARFTKVYIRTDCQTAIPQPQHIAPEPKEWLARRNIMRAQQLVAQGVKVEINWVLRHVRVEGYDQAEKALKKPAGAQASGGEQSGTHYKDTSIE